MQTSDMSSFDSAQLHMRPLGEGDEALYCRLYTDPGLMRNIAAPLSVDVARRSFGAACRQQSPHIQRWIVHERANGQQIGLLALVRHDGLAEVGVMLLDGWDGHGFATESMAALVDRVFSLQLMPQLYAHQSVADNPPVRRLMLKLGFTPLPQKETMPGEQEWDLQYEDWLARRAAREVAAQGLTG